MDHFRPPLSQRRHWDSFHGAWAEAMAQQLNQSLLPERYYAEARTKLGGQVEIDVATYEENGRGKLAEGGVAIWAPPKPAATVPLEFSDPDLFEVQVFTDQEGPRLVGAVELVSPANKDRPSNRRMFAVKCANYLQEGIGVMVVDVVTQRSGNLHSELQQLLQVQELIAPKGTQELYAAAYRTRPAKEKMNLDIWAETLTLGGSLPTLPLWIAPDQSVPLDLEQTYLAACTARRIG
jgi:hypothetical protein